MKIKNLKAGAYYIAKRNLSMCGLRKGEIVHFLGNKVDSFCLVEFRKTTGEYTTIYMPCSLFRKPKKSELENMTMRWKYD